MNYSTIKEMYDNLLDLDIETTKDERSELFSKLEMEDDFTWEVDWKEYRIISEDVIDKIHQDELKEIILDSYFQVEILPWWIHIDWEKTSENVLSADGYGNHFATYDGEEQLFRLDKVWYHVFRIN